MRAGSLSTSTRRAFIAVVVAALLCGASGMRALRAAGGEGQDQAAAAPPDGLKFAGDNALIIWTIKAANTADFEGAWTAIKAKLSASDKPDIKEQGTSLSIYKVSGPAGAPSTAYVFALNPPSKTLSYDPVKILYNPATPGMWERAEADALYKKIADGVEGITPLVLGKVGM